MTKKKSKREIAKEELALLKGFETVIRWMDKIESKSGSKRSKSVYLTFLKNFCNAIKKNPDQLIEQKKEDLKNEAIEVKRRLEEELTKYFNSLDDNYSRSYQMTMFYSIKSFFKANYYPLEVESPGTWDAPRDDKVPNVDELKLMIDCCDSQLQRALILFMSQSGQRAGVAMSLRYGMIREQLEKDESPIVVSVSSELKNGKNDNVVKRRRSYDFWLGRDSVDALKVYIKIRENQEGTIDDDDFVFKTEKKFRGKYVPLDLFAINNLIRRSVYKAGLVKPEEDIDKRGRKKSKIHSHSFRKFFQTNMEASGVPKSWIDYWMGHSKNSLDRAYSRPTIEQQKEAYEKGERNISISHLGKPELEKMEKNIHLRALIREAKHLHLDYNKFLEDEGYKYSVDEKIEVLEKEIDNQIAEWMNRRSEEDIEDVKIVTEEELIPYLKKGYKIERELNNGGKFLIYYRLKGRKEM